MPAHICHTLTQAALDQIETLHAVCQAPFSGPCLLGLVLPEAQTQEEDTFYALYYIEETLVSFLSCFCPDKTTCEISGFTAPRHRNRGFFSILLKKTKKEARRLFGNVTFHFQCLSSDPGTAAFCKTRNLAFSHSECIMEQVVTPQTFSAAGISLLPAAEKKLLSKLHAKAFACPMDLSAGYTDAILGDPDTFSYLILESKKPVGLLHLTFQSAKTVYLTGLGILPAYRGRGLAKAALQTVSTLLPEHALLTLQVSTLNTAAFRLYQTQGFEITSRLDYYSHASKLKTNASLHTTV